MSEKAPKKPKRDGALTDKQVAFAHEYLVDLNATQAAIRAGYSRDSARQIASENLAKPAVQDLVQNLMDKRSKRTEITADFVLAEILKIATADLGDAYDEKGNLKPIHEIPVEVRRAMAGVKVFEEFEGFGKERFKIGEVREVRFWDKPRALELLGRHLKLFTDKVEHSGKVEVESIKDEELDAKIAELMAKAGQK